MMRADARVRAEIVLPTDGVTEADMSALAVALSPDEDGI